MPPTAHCRPGRMLPFAPLPAATVSTDLLIKSRSDGGWTFIRSADHYGRTSNANIISSPGCRSKARTGFATPRHRAALRSSSAGGMFVLAVPWRRPQDQFSVYFEMRGTRNCRPALDPRTSAALFIACGRQPPHRCAL